MTKRRFKFGLAVLGILGIFFMALLALVFAPSDASAEKGTGIGHHQDGESQSSRHNSAYYALYDNPQNEPGHHAGNDPENRDDGHCVLNHCEAWIDGNQAGGSNAQGQNGANGGDGQSGGGTGGNSQGGQGDTQGHYAGGGFGGGYGGGFTPGTSGQDTATCSDKNKNKSDDNTKNNNDSKTCDKNQDSGQGSDQSGSQGSAGDGPQSFQTADNGDQSGNPSDGSNGSSDNTSDGSSGTTNDPQTVTTDFSITDTTDTDPPGDNPPVTVLTDAPVQVPEPFTLSLFAVGLGGAALLRRRSKGAAA